MAGLGRPGGTKQVSKSNICGERAWQDLGHLPFLRSACGVL